MTGPTRPAFADAILTPAAAFADPALAAADPVLGPDGLPLATPGERAVVFHLCGAGEAAWAVKCYPAADPGLADRYAAVARHGRRRLPFLVPARFLDRGVRVGAEAFPAAVLDWVEGVPLNRAVADRAGDPAAVHRLFRAWVRVAAGLRAAGVSHGELSHPNVLVSGDAVRLVDYDSFHAPGLPPAADAGHPNYAHPLGAAPADRDRFPLLVVATALRAVGVLGRAVWDDYDAGDNLLFAADDFRDPASSVLFRDLADAADPLLRTLAAALAEACRRPAAETPWLDDLCPEPAEKVPVALPLDTRPAPRPTKSEAAPPPTPVWRQLLIPLALAAGVLVVGAGGLAGILSAVLAPPDEVAANDPLPADPPRDEPRAVATRPAPKQPGRPGPAPEFANPAGAADFRKVWTKPVAFTDPNARPVPVLAPDGQTLFIQVANPNRIDVLDAKSGAALSALRGPGVPAGAPRVWPLGLDRVAVFGEPLAAPTVWNPRTGDRAADLLRVPVPFQPGLPHRVELSPDGRFVFTGTPGPGGGPFGGHFQLTEVGTGRTVRTGTWDDGAARFTADGGRLLVAEGAGRVRWLRLPGGEPDGEWAYTSAASDPVVSLSADGALLVLQVRPAGRPLGRYLVDGRTGQPLRRLTGEFQNGRCGLSADGRLLLGVGPAGPGEAAAAVLADPRTGAVLVRTPLNLTGADAASVTLADSGRAFAAYDHGRREVSYYELRGDVPPVPPGTPTPPAVAAVPPRDLPDDPFPRPQFPPPVVIRPVPAPQFPLQPVPVPPALPPVPALGAKWNTRAPVGLQANGMPQNPAYAPDGKTLLVSGGTDGTVLAFDAATGAALPGFDGHKGPGGVYWFGPFADKVVSRGFDANLATWDARTGKRVDDVKFPELPAFDPARGHGGITHAVSPTGRYTAVARRDMAAAGGGPLRVLDTTTGKTVVVSSWKAMANGGSIAFTADERKVFVLDGLGKGTWYKLPTGEVEAAWPTGDGPAAAVGRVSGVSADGTRMYYTGRLDGPGFVNGVIDGATGRLVAAAPAFPYQPGLGVVLAPDGRLAAVPVRDPATGTWATDVLAVDGWRPLGRITPPPGAQHEAPPARFSPDGKELAVLFRGAKQVAVYPVPDAGPAAAAPPPLVRVFPMVGPAPVNPAPGPAAAGGLAVRWTAGVPVGTTIAGVAHDPTSGRVLLTNPFSGLRTAVDARTGALAPPVADGPPGAEPGRAVVAGGRKESIPADAREAPVLNPGRGGRVAGFLKLPDLPPAAGGNSIDVRLSADGRFFAAGRRSHDRPAPLPLRVVERATGREVLATDWAAGSVHFTADGSRVLVVDAGGRCRWFKLPSGEADGAIDLAKGNHAPEVTAMSADGKRLGVNDPAAEPGATSAVLDGATGRVVRAFGKEYYYTSPVALSADGRLAAVMRSAPGAGSEMTVEVVDVATGASLGRATVTTANRSIPTFQLTADGTGLLIHDYSRQQLHWFDVGARKDAP